MLRNLDLKASALDDLDLPVKVLAGHLGEQKYPCGVSIIFKLLSVVGVSLGIFCLTSTWRGHVYTCLFSGKLHPFLALKSICCSNCTAF